MWNAVSVHQTPDIMANRTVSEFSDAFLEGYTMLIQLDSKEEDAETESVDTLGMEVA